MSNSKIVYSTDSNFEVCSDRSKQKSFVAIKEQKIKLYLDRKKGGKITTIIRGLILKNNDLKNLVREIKMKCASGGSVKNNDVIIQGNKREIIRKYLVGKGYNVKFSGG